ncbi:hypothetical protein EJB05_51109, partial [Eragrostis curvula]
MGEQAEKDHGPVLLPEDTVVEILLQLPIASVIRSGAVCKAWRRITTDPHFRAALAARGKTATSILLHTNLDGEPWPGSNLPARVYGAEDVALDALPISFAGAGWPDLHPLIRYPKTPLSMRDDHCRLLASCNGVLLFVRDEGRRYLLCNPVTRRWAELPRLATEFYNDYNHRDPEKGFYFHEPSGEFRLLGVLSAGIWFVASTGGATQPRQLHMSDEMAGRGVPSLRSAVTTPVALHGHLHWPLYNPMGVETTTEMVAFDILCETFHRMAGPPITPGKMKLFEMDDMLVAADFTKRTHHIDLWFLEDYGAARWEHRHRVESPWKDSGMVGGWVDLRSVAAAGDEEGNVILGDRCGGLLVYHTRRRMVVRRIIVDDENRRTPVHVTRHVFRGSVELHPSFSPADDVPLIHSWF